VQKYGKIPMLVKDIGINFSCFFNLRFVIYNLKFKMGAKIKKNPYVRQGHREKKFCCFATDGYRF